MPPRWLFDAAHAAFDLVYPPACLICDAPHLIPFGSLCADCETAIAHDPEIVCPRCASRLGVGATCTRCRTRKPRFDRALRLGKYEGRLRDAILRMKSSHGEALAGRLGERLAAKWARDGSCGDFDAAIPVPLHWLRRWGRGYNQSAAVAASFAACLGRPCWSHTLRRRRSTPLQTEQSVAGRERNVAGAFALVPWARLQGVRVVLIDDVLTTGATLNEAARLLLGAGAAQVRVAILAHR